MAVEKNIGIEELTNFHETLQNLSPNTNGEVLPFRNILMEENIASLQSHPKSCKQWTMEKRQVQNVLKIWNIDNISNEMEMTDNICQTTFIAK